MHTSKDEQQGKHEGKLLSTEKEVVSDFELILLPMHKSFISDNSRSVSFKYWPYLIAYLFSRNFVFPLIIAGPVV